MPGTRVRDQTVVRHAAVQRVARVLTELFAPAVLAAVMPLIIAIHASASLVPGLRWGVMAAVFSSAIPYGVIWWGVRRGQLTDHHIGVREQRRTPLALGLSSVLFGLLVLVLAGAPRQLVAMVVVMFAGLLMIAAVNQVWKLSAHTAVGAGAVSVLVMVFGVALLPAALVVVAVGWSRVYLRDHTPAQVTVGGIAGVVVAVPIYALLA